MLPQPGYRSPLGRYWSQFAVAAFLGGCHQLAGVEDTQLQSEEEASGVQCANADAGSPLGNGTGWWSGCAEETSCFSAGRPAPDQRPQADAEGPDIAPLVLGITRLRLGGTDEAGEPSQEAWRRVGLDLDGLCTAVPGCQGQLEARACAPRLSDVAQDGELCRDNQIGLLHYNLDQLPLLSGKYMATAAELDCAICRGAYNLLTRVSDYNGQLNDPSVRVDVFPAAGLTELNDVQCPEASLPSAGCWNPEQQWTVDEAYVTATDKAGLPLESELYDPAGYVRDGWLVVALPANTPIGLVSMHADVPPVLRIIVQAGVMVLRLGVGEPQWRSEGGVFAGRARLDDLRDEFANLGLCEATDAAAYSVANTFMESAADVLSTGANLPDAPCDALSLGLGVSLQRASFGRPVTVQKPSSPGCQ